MAVLDHAQPAVTLSDDDSEETGTVKQSFWFVSLKTQADCFASQALVGTFREGIGNQLLHMQQLVKHDATKNRHKPKPMIDGIRNETNRHRQSSTVGCGAVSAVSAVRGSGSIRMTILPAAKFFAGKSVICHTKIQSTQKLNLSQVRHKTCHTKIQSTQCDGDHGQHRLDNRYTTSLNMTAHIVNEK